MSKSSNQERTKRRSECRQALSDHLYTKLRLVITPTEVRLHPRHDDAYKWSVLPQKEHLFKNNLSKLTAGLYTQLIQGIGVFFEAVPNNPTGTVASTSAARFVTDEPEDRVPYGITINGADDTKDETFTSSITKLQKEVSLLREEACKWQRTAQIESQKCRKAEADMEKIKTAYTILRKHTLRFRINAQKSAEAARTLQAKLNTSTKGILQMADLTRELVEIVKT